MNSYLETALAVILVIIVFSIITYVIQELIAANLKFREKMLQHAIRQLLDGNTTRSNLTEKLYNHPQIKMLKEDLKKLPAYVPSSNFAQSIIDLVAEKSTFQHQDLFKDFQSGIEHFDKSNSDLGILLRNWGNNASSLKELQANIEKWFNEYMDRVTGWYKGKSTRITRFIALGIVVFFNLNMIAITKAIHHDSALKAKLVSAAETMAENENVLREKYLSNIDSVLTKLPNKSQASVDSVLEGYTQNRISGLQSLLHASHVGELPLGWNKATLHGLLKQTPSQWILMLLGWSIATGTLSMGAPFWFDLLLKIVNVRRAGTKPEGKA